MTVHLVHLAADEVKVKADRLAELEAKERAHDAYLRATQRMRQRLAGLDFFVRKGVDEGEWEMGYRDALTQFAELVVEEGANWQS